MAEWQLKNSFFSQKRLTAEREHVKNNSKVKKENGSKGGKAKALKDKETRLANATVSPQQTSSEVPSENENSLWRKSSTHTHNQNPQPDSSSPVVSKESNFTNGESKNIVTQDVTFRIFDHWRVLHEHPKAKLSDKRKRIITKALKIGYSEGDLMKAIAGCGATPFNMGLNEHGRKYDSIELILRDAEHIERFMDHADDPPKAAAGNHVLRQSIENARELLSEETTDEK